MDLGGLWIQAFYDISACYCYKLQGDVLPTPTVSCWSSAVVKSNLISKSPLLDLHQCLYETQTKAWREQCVGVNSPLQWDPRFPAFTPLLYQSHHSALKALLSGWPYMMLHHVPKLTRPTRVSITPELANPNTTMHQQTERCACHVCINWRDTFLRRGTSKRFPLIPKDHKRISNNLLTCSIVQKSRHSAEQRSH